MKRQPVKTISNKLIKFIPPEYKDMDEKAEKMEDRPLIFWGKQLTREKRLAMQDLTDIEYKKDPSEINWDELKPGDVKITGHGDSAKYVWDNCIVKIENVLIQSDGKEVEEIAEMTDTNILWNTKGLDSEIAQAVKFYVDQSTLTEAEAKN